MCLLRELTTQLSYNHFLLRWILNSLAKHLIMHFIFKTLKRERKKKLFSNLYNFLYIILKSYPLKEKCNIVTFTLFASGHISCNMKLKSSCCKCTGVKSSCWEDQESWGSLATPVIHDLINKDEKYHEIILYDNKFRIHVKYCKLFCRRLIIGIKWFVKNLQKGLLQKDVITLNANYIYQKCVTIYVLLFYVLRPL